MNDFPSRVTLYDDGVYRWRYDLDMWRNRYMLGLIVRILGLMLGIPTLILLEMVTRRALPLLRDGLPWHRIASLMRDDLLALAIVGGLLAGTILLTLIIYAVAAAAMGGTWRLRFQMDETAVALVRDPGQMKALNALGAATVVTGLVAGKAGEAMRVGATLAAINGNGTSRFEVARRVKILPGYDLLEMREWFVMNQIFVNGEDYPFVRDFILARLSDKARARSQRQAPPLPPTDTKEDLP